MLTFGSLFAGIGGMDLGLERAGWECRWQVEIDEWCRKVLTKHWPDVPKYTDVREVGGDNLERVDLIAGGFPCQPVSLMGHRLAQFDPRWLWPEFGRLVGELRPRYVLVENVTGLLTAGVGDVLGDLAACGYDAEWQCIPAAAVGAPHIRDRIFILAYPTGSQRPIFGRVPDRQLGNQADDWNATQRGQDRNLVALVPGVCDRAPTDWWRAQSRMARSTDGIPDDLDGVGRRVKGLGNAVVPQVAQWLGERILATA